MEGAFDGVGCRPVVAVLSCFRRNQSFALEAFLPITVESSVAVRSSPLHTVRRCCFGVPLFFPKRQHWTSLSR